MEGGSKGGRWRSVEDAAWSGGSSVSGAGTDLGEMNVQFGS